MEYLGKLHQAAVEFPQTDIWMDSCGEEELEYIYIEDNVRIALNTSILTNNHDFYERDVLTVKDVRICKNAWNGAGVTILPGVTIGENAIVGAASVATKDVAPNTVVAGNPAKVIRELDGERFKEE